MKIFKWLGIIFGIYIAFVVVFEKFFLGMYQPKLEGTGLPMLVLTTTDASGVSHDRRLAQLLCQILWFLSDSANLAAKTHLFPAK